MSQTVSPITVILEGLNPQQRQAVEAKDGPTLIIAGPGSGKTRVLTARVAYLILARNVFPYRIMAVTFTNKAAREMRDRLTRMVGSAADEVAMGTFHSICARMLRRDAVHAGLDHNFVIYDTDDQIAVVKAALAAMNLDEKKYKPASIHAKISNAKNELIAPEDYKPESYLDEIVGRVYAEYNKTLRANNAVDFDDLLMESVKLMRNNAAVRERMQERYAHVLVDEFQDTNIAQYELVKLIAGKHRNLMGVGDPDQSIYKWRGADYRNVLRLQEDFPNLQVIPLEQNYRSTQTILDAAMAVIKRNPNRKHINLFTERGAGPKIVVREMFNEDEEAQYVIDTIREVLKQKAAQPGEIAIMYRTNAQSRAMEDAFVRAGMAYKLVGATRFYARKEIKDVLAYLRIVNNPADFVSLKRVINTPTRGIGEGGFAALEQASRAARLPPLEAIKRGLIQGRAAKPLAEFGAIWEKWVALRDDVSVGQLFDQIVKTSGYREFCKDGTDEGEDRWANVMELRNVAAGAGDAPLSDFLNDVALVSETDNYEESAAAPTLLTLHAAKGLEFRVVFIVGLLDGVLPHSRTLDNPEEIAEERRLFYVGITRAKERLYLLRSFRRGQWGQSDVFEPSRFLRDLPNTLVDGVLKKNSEIQRDVTRWDAPSPAPARPAASSLQTGAKFKPGDRVKHARFGAGIVIRSMVVRDDEEVDVFFEGVGAKKLSAMLSGLKKA